MFKVIKMAIDLRSFKTKLLYFSILYYTIKVINSTITVYNLQYVILLRNNVDLHFY